MHCVPTNLLHEVISSEEALWPVLPYSPSAGTCKYFSLNDVLVAPDTDSRGAVFADQLMSLASAGICITQVPPHINDVMSGNNAVKHLTPINARNSLLVCKFVLRIIPSSLYKLVYY
jgi:hypothetical protein